MSGVETLRVGVRHWDHVIPLALGDVRASGVDLALDRRDATPGLWASDELDLSETSLSQYLLRRAAGDDSVTALPLFVMAGFRQRCIITRADSELQSLAELSGKTVGLTGWPDSGNTWTRALLRREGVELGDVSWRVGPLTKNHPVTDRIGPYSTGSFDVAHTDGNGAMMDQLDAGVLDAVMTPFMPPGFFEPGSPWRTVIPNVTAAEMEYFGETQYVPGMHVMAVKTAVLDRSPEFAQAIVDAFEESRRLADERRRKLQDVYPWTDEALRLMLECTGPDWLPYGASRIRGMIDDFVGEHLALGTLEAPVGFDELFPFAVDPQPAR